MVAELIRVHVAKTCIAAKRQAFLAQALNRSLMLIHRANHRSTVQWAQRKWLAWVVRATTIVAVVVEHQCPLVGMVELQQSAAVLVVMLWKNQRGFSTKKMLR